jgi:endonuclease I
MRPPHHDERNHAARISGVLAVLASCSAAMAQAPAGYYASVDASSPAALRASLHAVIDDHLRLPYTASTTDTWDVLELACQDPANSTRILDVYSNASYQKSGGGNQNYDREHTWPNSYGFPQDGTDNSAYTDCHMLWLCRIDYNSARGNMPYRACSASCQEFPTTANNGQGGGSGTYIGNSNWASGAGSTGTWETWIGRRGDVARSILYADLRYEGGSHGGTGAAEPDLRVTDNAALIQTTGGNASVAYMGLLSTLLQWHQEDPPDAFERNHNNVVFQHQGNRNPFIDHPEWALCLHSGACGTGVAYCAGDGTGTACPCANHAPAGSGAGCLNSLAQGATLRATGVASIAGDTLRLSGAGMPNSSALYFQGTTQDAAGTVFGDGKRCAAGSVIRLGTKVNAAGGSQWPGAGDPAVSVRGAVPAGATRHYQVWYRNSAAFCGPSTFNLSNGLSISWTP